MSSAPLPQLPSSENFDKSLNKLNTEKQLVLEAYRQLRGNVTEACDITQFARNTFYWLVNNDPDFKAAKDLADLALNDEIRDRLINKAINQDDLGAIIFYLKSRHPDFKPTPYAAAEFKDGDKSMKFIISRE